MDAEKIAKSSQEQAVAAWIDYLNQLRLSKLLEALSKQDGNYAAAIETLKKSLATIKDEIIDRNRGGLKGMHGFIAEVAECGIGNARQQIIGKTASHVWINDNGLVDFMRGTEAIQQKFFQPGSNLSLKAISEHLRQYPDFITNGGKYQIPKDQFDKIKAYLEMPADVANKLPTSTGEFSLRQWEFVQKFFKEENINIKNIEPSMLEYSDVQAGAIADTIRKEKEHLKTVDREQRDSAYQESKPTMAEGLKTAAVGAAVEAASSFVLAITRKIRSGKKIKEFDKADWNDILGDSGKGFVKGVVRSISVYTLTNFTATPAAVATSITTAAFGVAEQVHLFRKGELNEVELIENSEILCLDAAVSAVSSLVGQVLIPVPALGAIIGNAVGTTIYQIGKDSFSRKENELLERYLSELEELDEKLDLEYKEYVEQTKTCYADYIEILTYAFSPDVEEALDGSVALAKRLGVPSEEILDSYDGIVTYFLN
jgi:hypothetical protein